MSDTKYTHGHHESVLRSHRRQTAENSAGYLLPYLRPGMTILDVGCGPGTITAESNLSFLALDIYALPAEALTPPQLRRSR